MEYLSTSPEKTLNLAGDFGVRLQKGNLVSILGGLGSGKTIFVKGIAGSLGIPQDAVKSPTFALLNQYCGSRGILYHFDFYRLVCENAGYRFDWNEILSTGIAVVEWGEACPEQPDYTVKIDKLSGDERRIVIEGSHEPF
ncbi:MAG: tRNA (adenosine(37)-N6)-threonylcarbamoyltransferase complex ATPase subunit type 1 TsaE [Candidatus Wallbacteria bacterium]|nr:tRNA (adenosine(37)-N6)-threonylcarbamoyltransferase complex ATPase subunit type 1 TsaE [Candidatus Wallbacteria bacterium]